MTIPSNKEVPCSDVECVLQQIRNFPCGKGLGYCIGKAYEFNGEYVGADLDNGDHIRIGLGYISDCKGGKLRLTEEEACSILKRLTKK